MSPGAQLHQRIQCDLSRWQEFKRRCCREREPLPASIAEWKKQGGHAAMLTGYLEQR